MASSIALDNFIRKLRKKLRQIEHLERLNRPLSTEELTKVGSKTCLREDLRAALVKKEEIIETDEDNHKFDEDISSSDIVLEHIEENSVDQCHGDDHIMLASHSMTDAHETDVKHSYGDHSIETQSKHLYSDQKATSPAQTADDDIQKKSARTKLKRTSLSRCQCRISCLQGHNDLVTALVIVGDKLVTASRDTTLKCWDLNLGVEVRSYGGHTETVTCVLLLESAQAAKVGAYISTDDRIIVSGSFDCSFKLWSLMTGKLLKSVYTYNPVSTICYSSHTDMLITGSEGGKLDLWDLATGDSVCSVLAHEASITGTQTKDNAVYSSDSDGIIKVHQITEERQLSCLFQSEDVKTVSGHFLIPRHIRCLELGPRGILFGDDARNIKFLNWKKGTVEKVGNHTTSFASTDALRCHEEYLLAASYDLDNGLGFINIRDAKNLDYLATVDDRDTERIVCLDYGHLASGQLVIASGGMELKLWEILRGEGRTREEHANVINLQFRVPLSRPAIDSEEESSGAEDDEYDGEDDFDDEEETEEMEGEDQIRRQFRNHQSAQEGNGWMSWCTLL